MRVRSMYDNMRLSAPMRLPPVLNGRYEIRKLLARGGMGLVYRAFDRVVRRDVALKTLRDAPIRSALQLFHKECEVLAALSHPNIVEIFDIGEYEEQGVSLPYFVMPLLPGATLDKLIRDRKQRLSADRIIDIIQQTCRGLHAAHERGLVHRDMKPSNIFVMQDDSVKIIDFGVAHMANSESSLRQKGTLLYMAPEQLEMKPPSPLSDLFSVAVVAYEALTRQCPFERPTEPEIIEAILNFRPPLASEANGGLSPAVARVIQKGMAKAPIHRFANVREFSETLRKAAHGEPVEFLDPARVQPRVERATKAYESGDPQFAAEILSELEAEGHASTSIGELRRQIDEALRKQQVGTLVYHAQTRFDQGELPLALQKVQEALAIEPSNTAALRLKAIIERTTSPDSGSPLGGQPAVEALLECARVLVHEDWKAAEPLIQQALELDPSNMLGKSLHAVVVDRRREEEVVRVFVQARQLRASGDRKAALELTEECLARYPLEERLAQLRDILTKELQEQAAARAAEPEPPPEQATAPGADSAAEHSAAPLSASVPDSMPDPLPEVAETPSPPVLPAQKAAQPVEAAGPSQKSGRRMPRWVWAAVGSGAVLTILGGVVFVSSDSSPQARSTLAAVVVRTSPSGANIRVNGQMRGISDLTVQLLPGKYWIEASLEGYETAGAGVAFSFPPVKPVSLALQPVPQAVRVVSDLESAQVYLDGQAAAPLQEGQLTMEAVARGKHTLKVADRDGEASFAFEIVPGAAPIIEAPPAPRNVVGLLVSSAGHKAKLLSTLANAEISIDGQQGGEAGASGFDVPLAPGTHEIALRAGKEHRKFIVETGAAPGLAVLLQSDRNVGTILLVTGEEDVAVFIDGRKFPRTTRRGQLRIGRTPKEYRIRVAKNGFQETPEQLVQVQKGEEVKVEFQLHPIPTTATLAIRGAAAGTQVFIDQAAAGATDGDGNFSADNLKPGEHTIELRRERFRPKTVRKQFAAGETVHLEPSEISLETAPGTLRLTLSPTNAVVTLQRRGESQPRALTERTASLQPGRYSVTARASGYRDRTESVEVMPGQTATLDLTLLGEPLAEKRAAPVAGNPMEGFGSLNSWTMNGKWYARKGGDFVLHRATPGGGTFAFSILGPAGGVFRGKRLQWVVDYADERNYLLFQIDKDSFRRIQCVNGKKTEMLKKPHGVAMKDYIVATLLVDITKTGVVHKIRKDGQWVVLDTFAAPDRSPAAGKFGLYVPGKDELSISDFGFYPAQ